MYDKTIFDKEIIYSLSQNQYDIFTFLLRNGKSKRECISKETGISWTTCYNNLIKLKNKKLVYNYKIDNGKKGRPSVIWRIKQAHDFVLLKKIGKKIGVVGSGEYKNKKIVIQKLEEIVDKECDIIVSGHSPRNEKETKDGKKYYDNVDIWAELWAYNNCENEPIIHHAKIFIDEWFFKRNKKIAIDSLELHVFINRYQYISGAWNTVKHFIEKPDFKIDNLYIYDEYGKKLKFEEFPEWCKNKINLKFKMPKWIKKYITPKEIKNIQKEIKMDDIPKKKNIQKEGKSNNHSYISRHIESDIITFFLNRVNKIGYFSVTTMRKMYIDDKKKNKKYVKINNENTVISNRISRIAKELVELDILKNVRKGVYKNLYKYKLIEILKIKLPIINKISLSL